MSNNQQILLTLLFAFPCHDPVVTMASPSQSSSSHQQSSLPHLLQVTAGGNIRGDLLIGVPVSFLLPTIGFNTAYKKIRKRRTRMDNEIEHDNGKDPLMSRLDFLFEVLDIDNVDCQQRVICEAVKNQEKFSPLSDLLIPFSGNQETRWWKAILTAHWDGITTFTLPTLVKIRKKKTFVLKNSQIVPSIQVNWSTYLSFICGSLPPNISPLE